MCKETVQNQRMKISSYSMYGFAAVFSSFASVADAQTMRCTEHDVTQEIDRAIEARRHNGQEQAAYARLQTLWNVCPSPRVQVQLALAEQDLGHFGDAYVHLRQALSVDNDAWIRPRRGALATALDEITAHLPRLSPLCNVVGAELRVDDRRVGTLPLAVPEVLTQRHVTLEVRAPGYEILRVELHLADGEIFRTLLTLTRTPALVPVAPVDSPHVIPEVHSSPPNRTRSIIAYSALGLGAIAGALSLWQTAAWVTEATNSRDATVTQPDEFGAWARFQLVSNTQGRLPGSTVCDLAAASTTQDALEVSALCSTHRQHAALALGFGLTSVALIASGVVLLVTTPSQTHTPRQALRVGPWIGSTFQGATLVTEF
jgi:hypothetical protein